MNSTDVLKALQDIEAQEGYNGNVDIANLAIDLDISVNKLVSILTELEHRDEVSLNITNNGTDNPDAMYKGEIRLLKRPPDEE
jgi:hypothetical protein